MQNLKGVPNRNWIKLVSNLPDKLPEGTIWLHCYNKISTEYVAQSPVVLHQESYTYSYVGEWTWTLNNGTLLRAKGGLPLEWCAGVCLPNGLSLDPEVKLAEQMIVENLGLKSKCACGSTQNLKGVPTAYGTYRCGDCDRRRKIDELKRELGKKVPMRFS